MAPGWDEACIVDSFQCFISEVVDGCEPLLGSTIDDWVLAAPAVCVLMVDGFLAKEVAFMSQSGDDRAFCVPDALALEEFACFSSHVAFFINRADDFLFQLASVFIRFVNFKVFNAVSRSGMNAACAGIKGDMVAFEDIDSAVINGQRMMEGCEVPFSAEHFAAYEFVVFNLAVSHGSRSEFLAHEVVFISGFVVYPYIGEFRVHADVEGCRDSPRCGGPDNGKELGWIDAVRPKALDIHSRILDVDGRGFSVLVFDFCFSQGCFAVRAPVNGFLALVNVVLLGHFAEDFEFLSFEVRIEGDVWMLEIADNAHADEVFLLDSDPFLSVFQALSAQFERGHVGAVFTGVLEDCVFDRKAVSIPARDVVGIVASHVFVTDDDVL